jgi:hypothetical protein
MRAISLTRGHDLFSVLRDMVEDGIPDGPALVYYDSKPCMRLGSIHAAACLSVRESPGCRFVPYVPHPKAPPLGPRMSALLAAAAQARAERAARRAAKAKRHG